MTSHKFQDPLETLQLMVTDVLVQTGKALRASRKDGLGNAAQAHGSLQSKLPETIRTFHSALDDLENDIIRAKSVLLRDISEIQARRNPPVPVPQPVESQSRSPMVIDIDSSSPVDTGHQPVLQTDAVKQMAPFPDMGLDPSESTPPAVPIKDEAVLSDLSLLDSGDDVDVKTENNAAPPAAMAPMPLMDEPNMDDPSGGQPPELAPDQPDSRLNFTDMAFTLATNTDAQDNQTTKEEEPNFDLTSFAPPESAEDISLDSLLPPKPTTETAVPTTETHDGSTVKQRDTETKPEATGDGLDQVYSFPADVNDGTDFDFDIDADIDVNMGGDDTFDDLMNTRDQTFDDIMEHGNFDAAYFGLENEET